MYGFTFGFLDIEDQLVRSPALLREALHREARVCYPLGAASGGVAAIVARLLEQKAEYEDPDLAYSRGLEGRQYDSL